MVNRSIAILLAASMAHLVIAGGDLMCASHGNQTLAKETPASMPGMHHDADTGAAGKHHCNLPTRSDCCEAMTTCAATFALAWVAAADAPAHANRVVVSVVADAPLRSITPPDPPPPKA